MTNSSKILTYEEYQNKIKSLKTLSDVTNFAKELVAPTIEAMLEAERDRHLGYNKYSPQGINSGNSRNGKYQKKIKTTSGEMQINIPRDRNGTFEPIVVKKYENTESEVEERIIAMYAKGLSTRDIEEYMKDIYGINTLSPETISEITNKVIPHIHEWQTRPLQSIYPICYLDGIHFKVRDGGKIVSKCAYIILGINLIGHKEILGIWIGENEGAKFWMQILNEIKNRSVENILIACIDGLKGFKEAIKAVYPETEVQECIVHMIRNTIKYIPHVDKKSFCTDLRKIYTAPTEEAGYQELQNMKEKWKQYVVYLNSWETKWNELSTFFIYPPEIRRIIYTNNTIESLNRQFRKVTKTTNLFSHDTALLKLLWLAQRDITKKWNMPIANWGKILPQFAIIFPEKIKL